MYLDNFKKMDPIMLMSIINMKLRDEFDGDLNELVKTYSIDKIELEQKLMEKKFIFNSESKRFIESK